MYFFLQCRHPHIPINESIKKTFYCVTNNIRYFLFLVCGGSVTASLKKIRIDGLDVHPNFFRPGATGLQAAVN